MRVVIHDVDIVIEVVDSPGEQPIMRAWREDQDHNRTSVLFEGRFQWDEYSLFQTLRKTALEIIHGVAEQVVVTRQLPKPD